MGLFEILKGEQPGIIETLLNYENAGQFGEFSIEYALTNGNLNGNFAVIKNLYVPIKGKTTEIDLLMIHEKGIFVFESKNYSGWIFGDSDQLNWTQCLQNGKKFHFYNPIRQNKTHITALAQYMKISSDGFTSFIVFSERCSLKKVPPSSQKVVIVRRPDMLREIRVRLNNSTIIFSESEIRTMATQLSHLANRGNDEKQQHIKDIQTSCPFCGCELVLRNGKYGQFWGCSAYPKCRFTKQIEKGERK